MLPDPQIFSRLDLNQVRGKIRRAPHRSPIFQIMFPISHMMDELNRPLVEGDELKKHLLYLCEIAIDKALREARSKVKNHP